MTSLNMCLPTWLSTAESGSSKRMTSASLYTARATDTRCFWPPLRLMPCEIDTLILISTALSLEEAGGGGCNITINNTDQQKLLKQKNEIKKGGKKGRKGDDDDDVHDDDIVVEEECTVHFSVLHCSARYRLISSHPHPLGFHFTSLSRKWHRTLKWVLPINESLAVCVCSPYFLSNFCHVSSRKNFQIRFQRACFQHLVVLLLIEVTAEEYVVPQGVVLNPCLLWYKRQWTLWKQTFNWMIPYSVLR